MDEFITRINNWSAEQYVQTFGGLFEESPWVAEHSYGMRPFASFEHMMNVMKQVVLAADTEVKLQLLRNHPDLGARIRMSDSSVQEQAGAGLNSLSPVQFEEMNRLNRKYTDRLGFPFIMAVKGHHPDSILHAMRQRNERSWDEEFRTALGEVFNIASIRLEQWITQAGTMSASSGGRITTHVLDTSRGVPAAGVNVELYRMTCNKEMESWSREGASLTNTDGRLDAPLLDGSGLQKGIYELRFHVEKYYSERLGEGDGPSLLWTVVPIRFTVSDANSHYHIPLLIAPGGYSTYRGS
ncbi:MULTISPECIES: 2-oxo-4-hydroxy-4-carboxy-5-ureidoimidazoline decarboxylase [Paenibacillus]|uniref:2-oxo-4-hydroxy-4-carboxy-5-ureidoimidazoline decarboxylase n=1 Tax=Paenibacillus TaxID=44249 RepID=UPI0030DB39F6